MGSISHQLPRMLGPRGDGGEGRDRTGVFSASLGDDPELAAERQTSQRKGAAPSPFHTSLALVPGEERHVSETGHESLVPRS